MSEIDRGADQPRQGFSDADDDTVLVAQIIELKAQLDEARAEQIRALADIDNQRKRLAREAEQTRRYASERLLSDLLPVADTLDAGLKAGGDDPARLREGFALTRRQFIKVLESHGVAELDPKGEPFDPELHQAMAAVDVAGTAPGTVVDVLQKGWRLHERLLRPALVAVVRDPGA